MAKERLRDLLRFALSEKAVIDKDAKRTLANGFNKQRGHDRAVDPSAHRAQNLGGRSDKASDARNLFLYEAVAAPVGGYLGDVEQESLKDGAAIQRVRDLGVKLHAVLTLGNVFKSGDRACVGLGRDIETRRSFKHPDLHGSSRPAGC